MFYVHLNKHSMTLCTRELKWRNLESRNFQTLQVKRVEKHQIQMSINIFNFKCWGFGALLKGHLSRGNEGGESAGYSLPPLTIHTSSRLELATVQLQVRLSNI